MGKYVYLTFILSFLLASPILAKTNAKGKAAALSKKRNNDCKNLDKKDPNYKIGCLSKQASSAFGIERPFNTATLISDDEPGLGQKGPTERTRGKESGAADDR